MRPVLIELFGFPIRAYGAFVGAALVVGMTLVMRYGRKLGIDPVKFLDVCFGSVIAGLVGGRLMYIVVHAGDFRGHWLDALAVWQGGMMYFGGLVLGIGYGMWIARKKGIPLWGGADCIAPAMGASQAIGRIACLCAGCCYGQTVLPGHSAWIPFGIRFPVDPNPLNPLASLPPAFQGVDLIPTQILQILEGLALWALGAWLFRKRRFAGEAFLLTFAAGSVTRFLIEGLRGDDARGFLFEGTFGDTWSSSRVLGIAMMVAALLVWAYRASRWRESRPRAAAPEAPAPTAA